jgi:hypothetical protein
MIEFTFMGRRYALLACRLSEVGELTHSLTPATQGDLEAAGYQSFTRPVTTARPCKCQADDVAKGIHYNECVATKT